MNLTSTTTIKNEILALGDRLSDYHDYRLCIANGNTHAKSEVDLRQAIDEHEECVFHNYEIDENNKLWTFVKHNGRFDFFRLRVLSLLAANVAAGNNLSLPVLDLVKTCRSLGEEDLDTALGKLVQMIKDGVLTANERFPPYLITSEISLADSPLKIYASKLCLVRPSTIPVGSENKNPPLKRKVKPQRPSSPQEIYGKLREYVIDQDDAARMLSSRGFLHLQRARLLEQGLDSGFNQCILMLGSSGCGKTYAVERFCKVAHLPFASLSMPEYTCVGFVGHEISDQGLQCLLRHPLASGSVERARYGVLVCDEIDKKADRSEGDRLGVSTTSVQDELLRLVEGCSVTLGHSHRNASGQVMDTNGLMTILAGAFSGLKNEMRKVCRQDGGMGFGRSENPARATAYLNDALISFGLIPELVGRLNGVCILKDLTVESLERIVTSKHGVLASYNEMLKPQGLVVDLEPLAIRTLAAYAHETGTQARGLRTGMGLLLEDAIFCQVQGKMTFSAADVKHALDQTCVLALP